MNLPPLTTPCKKCKGKGGWFIARRGNEFNVPIQCPKCGGHGCFPTAAGKQILKLVRLDNSPIFQPYAF